MYDCGVFYVIIFPFSMLSVTAIDDAEISKLHSELQLWWWSTIRCAFSASMDCISGSSQCLNSRALSVEDTLCLENEKKKSHLVGNRIYGLEK